MDNFKLKVVYTTIDSPDTLLAMQQQLVKLKLAVCTNSFKVSSCYHWSGKVTNDNEIGMLIKTHPQKVNALCSYLELHHPYEVPMITLQDASVNKKYYKWMLEQLELEEAE